MNLEYIYSKIVKKLRGRSLKNVHVGRGGVINSGSNIMNSELGDYSYCGYDCLMNSTIIGKFCSIGNNVCIGLAEHPIDWVSTSPVFEKIGNSSVKVRFAEEKLPPIKKTTIGNDVWIGDGAHIKQGVSIGNGAIVGALAMVTKDVPPYAIVGGVPARIIRYRFENEIIKKLEHSQWWNLDNDSLFQVGKFIKEPLLFIEEVTRIKQNK